jgi:hypothetical protein
MQNTDASPPLKGDATFLVSRSRTKSVPPIESLEIKGLTEALKIHSQDGFACGPKTKISKVILV